MSYSHLTQREASSVISNKLELVQEQLSICMKIAQEHGISFSVDLGDNSLEFDPNSWYSSNEDWEPSDWQESNC